MSEGEIDIPQESISQLLNDPDEYKTMIINILEGDMSPEGQRLYELLSENIITGETDMLLRSFSTIVPYNFLLPLLRDQLGLTIKTDNDCVTALDKFKKYVGPEDAEIIDNIIDFLSGDDGAELDENIVPEIDLVTMLDKIPVDLYPEVYNCVDYILETSEDVDIN
jgi:hypothetical protein